MLEYTQEIAVGIVLGLCSYFIIKKLYVIEVRQLELDKRLAVAEAHLAAYAIDTTEIKSILVKISSDLSELKEERGFWRGHHLHENQK